MNYEVIMSWMHNVARFKSSDGCPVYIYMTNITQIAIVVAYKKTSFSAFISQHFYIQTEPYINWLQLIAIGYPSLSPSAVLTGCSDWWRKLFAFPLASHQISLCHTRASSAHCLVCVCIKCVYPSSLLFSPFPFIGRYSPLCKRTLPPYPSHITLPLSLSPFLVRT